MVPAASVARAAHARVGPALLEADRVVPASAARVVPALRWSGAPGGGPPDRGGFGGPPDRGGYGGPPDRGFGGGYGRDRGFGGFPEPMPMPEPDYGAQRFDPAMPGPDGEYAPPEDIDYRERGDRGKRGRDRRGGRRRGGDDFGGPEW